MCYASSDAGQPAGNLLHCRFAFRFGRTLLTHKIFNSRTRDECLGPADQFFYATAPDQIDDRQTRQADFAGRLDDVDPLSSIRRFYLFAFDSFALDVACAGGTARAGLEAHDFSPGDIDPSLMEASGQSSSSDQLPYGLPRDSPGARGVAFGHP